MLVILVGRKGILGGYHYLMEFLAGADSHFLLHTSGKHCLCQIRNLEGRDFTDKGFSAFCLFQSFDYQLYTLFQADPETGHAEIRNGKFCLSLLNQRFKEGNHRATAACHVAVTHDGEAGVLCSHVGIGCDKQLVGYQLGSAIEVYRVNRLIGGQGYYLFHSGFQCCINDILCTVDIGFNCFIRVIFTGRYLFQSCCVDDIIHVFKSTLHTVTIPYITDEETKLVIRVIFPEVILHIKLFKLVTGIDNDFLRIIMLQSVTGETFTERTGSSGD